MSDFVAFPANFEYEPAHRAGRAWIIGVLAFLLLGTCALYFSPLPDSPDYWQAIGIGVGAVSLCAILSLRTLGFGWYSPAFVYIGFLWLFHFPMTLLLNLFPDLALRVGPPASSWTQSASWSRASVYALLCVLGYALGVALASGARRSRAPAPSPGAARFQVGIATALGGLAWLYFIMFRETGVDLFGSGYAHLYETVFGSDFATAVFLVTVGCGLALMRASSGMTWLPVTLQLAASVPVLLTGARQFALIGPLVLAVLAAKRGIRFGFLGAAVSCALMLWLISYVGETRGRGVTEATVSPSAVSPVDALVEMGASLETSSLAIDWVQNGDSYLLGGSYWLPFERGLGLVLPLRKELATDARAMNMVMVSRISGLGGSAVAESYYNFSLFGALFFLALGVLLTRMDLSPRLAVSMDLLGVTLYAFLFQARNWFISVPRFLLIGTLPLLLCLLVDAVARRRETLETAPRASRLSGEPV